uniref:Bm9619 n=1 Tax=Brugia malayi TaxID=6279 RepID=A0A1I9GCY9_BRUMA|nr:Bm9619 [Brugia malayi]
MWKLLRIKDIKIDKDEPIAMRTRSNTKRQSRLKENQTTTTAPSSETCRDLHDQR